MAYVMLAMCGRSELQNDVVENEYPDSTASGEPTLAIAQARNGDGGDIDGLARAEKEVKTAAKLAVAKAVAHAVAKTVTKTAARYIARRVAAMAAAAAARGLRHAEEAHAYAVTRSQRTKQQQTPPPQEQKVTPTEAQPTQTQELQGPVRLYNADGVELMPPPGSSYWRHAGRKPRGPFMSAEQWLQVHEIERSRALREMKMEESRAAAPAATADSPTVRDEEVEKIWVGDEPPPGTRVSDAEAESFVRLAHNRLGHRSKKQIRMLLESGELEGPCISAAQWENINVLCSQCLRDLQRAQPSRRVGQKPLKDLRMLEEVYVDIVGPRKFPSLKYRGERGNHHGGGNWYMALYVERKYKRVFIDFLHRKSDLERSVRRMRKHIARSE